MSHTRPVISYKLTLYLFAQGTVIVLYYGTMWITPFKAVVLPITFIDRAIAFHFLFAYIYISFFIQLFISILFSGETHALSCARAIVINSVIASFIFYFYPTTMSPVFYYDQTNTSYFLSRFIQSMDKNYNCFPSLHIANSLVASYYFSFGKRVSLKIFSWTWFLLISLSVISTRQHYFYDVVAGAGLAVISIFLLDRLKRKNDQKNKAGQWGIQ